VVARLAQRHGAHGDQRLARPFVQGREETFEARIHDGQYHVVQRPPPARATRRMSSSGRLKQA